jgi:N-acetyl-anhydromuramyl-L-alanine amidase AmpD
MPDTDQWPFMPAKYFTRVTGTRKVRLVVIHSMESQEKGDTAENVARYFQNIPRPASAHLCVDADSIVQCVRDNDVAFAAPGVNRDGIHIELAGYSKQTEAEWLDPYGVLMLDKAANAAAQYCLKFDLPVAHLSLQELKDGKRGIIGHWDATQTYKPNAGHTDPGQNFPWAFFIKRVGEHHARLQPKKG